MKTQSSLSSFQRERGRMLRTTGRVTVIIRTPTKTNGQRYPQEEAMIPPNKGPAAIPRAVID